MGRWDPYHTALDHPGLLPDPTPVAGNWNRMLKALLAVPQYQRSFLVCQIRGWSQYQWFYLHQLAFTFCMFSSVADLWISFWIDRFMNLILNGFLISLQSALSFLFYVNQSNLDCHWWQIWRSIRKCKRWINFFILFSSSILMDDN